MVPQALINYMCKSSKALTWCGCLFSYEVIFVYSIYGGHPAWLMHHGPRLLHLDKAQIILMPSLPFCGYCCIISVIHSVNNVRYSSQPLAIQLDRCLFTCTCAYLMPASCFSQSNLGKAAHSCGTSPAAAEFCTIQLLVPVVLRRRDIMQ